MKLFPLTESGMLDGLAELHLPISKVENLDEEQVRSLEDQGSEKK
jgi:hypothetical protein